MGISHREFCAAQPDGIEFVWKISSLLEVLKSNDEDGIVDTLRQLKKVASESLFFEPEIVDSLFLQQEDFLVSAFKKFKDLSPPSAVLTTLARISLFPHLRIADCSLQGLYRIIEPQPKVIKLLPSPIFPSSSPHQQYSGLSFLAALAKKLRIVFKEFQTNLPTDPSHLPKFMQLTKADPNIFTYSLPFCRYSFLLPKPLMKTTSPIKVDSEIIQELILFVKEALPTILTYISTIDNLIACLPSDSSPTIPLASEDDSQMIESLKHLRDDCEDFVSDGWRFFIRMTYTITEPHKSSFQTILLDDPSFFDLILNSLKLTPKDIRANIIITLINIVVDFPSMKEQFMKANLVERMFETVDFVSLPLSESDTLAFFTKFIAHMFELIGETEFTRFQQYRLIRVSVFEPAKQFITFMFRNSDKLILNEDKKTQLENYICWIHFHINSMELRSNELDADVVSELVKWEMRVTVEMENEDHFLIVFHGMLNRTWEWKRDQRERQKRREVVLREEGWDDGFELQVVGIEKGTGIQCWPTLSKVGRLIICRSSLFRLRQSVLQPNTHCLALITSSFVISPHRVETGHVVIGVGGVLSCDGQTQPSRLSSSTSTNHLSDASTDSNPSTCVSCLVRMGISHREFCAAQPDGIEFVSKIQSLLEVLESKDEDIIVDTLRTLQKVASGVLFYRYHRFVDDSFGCCGYISDSGSNDSFDDWYSSLSPLCCVPHSSGLVVSPFLFC
ncbi:hypothetical protein BLNAU_18292 [Blattamonas nauphoetae]|uniref:FPL domain-containing protein n=1 Tax=Blattamonas nauphoetae TaxID=2049346 RepID=A0ABQ9X4Y6_9EUKA|nr:hypothetical protein BLNAU_18292 [Blattamonas nauphoetae]